MIGPTGMLNSSLHYTFTIHHEPYLLSTCYLKKVRQNVQGTSDNLFIICSIQLGCGKTEIARRIAKLSEAPFIKVEATKFTEVGFHGKDVDQIIRDLVDVAINMTKKKIKEVIKYHNYRHNHLSILIMMTFHNFILYTLILSM